MSSGTQILFGVIGLQGQIKHFKAFAISPRFILTAAKPIISYNNGNPVLTLSFYFIYNGQQNRIIGFRLLANNQIMLAMLEQKNSLHKNLFENDGLIIKQFPQNYYHLKFFKINPNQIKMMGAQKEQINPIRLQGDKIDSNKMLTLDDTGLPIYYQQHGRTVVVGIIDNDTTGIIFTQYITKQLEKYQNQLQDGQNFLKKQNLKLNNLTFPQKFTDSIIKLYKNQTQYKNQLNIAVKHKSQILFDFENILYTLKQNYYNQFIPRTKEFNQKFADEVKKLLSSFQFELHKGKDKYNLLDVDIIILIKMKFIHYINSQSSKQFRKNLDKQFISIRQSAKYQCQKPLQKLFAGPNHRIIVIIGPVQQLVKIILKRYINYSYVIVMDQISFINDQTSKYSNYKCYNRNRFYQCWGIEEHDQNELQKILLANQGVTLDTNGQIEKTCGWYTKYRANNQKQSFYNYYTFMNKFKQWDIVSSKNQQFIFNGSPFQNKDQTKLTQLSSMDVQDFVAQHKLDFQKYHYEWCHLIAKKFGGIMSVDNGYIGPTYFNRVMQRYQTCLYLFNEMMKGGLRKIRNIHYQITTFHPRYGPDNGYKYGLCPYEVKIVILANLLINDQVIPVALLRNKFDPFLNILPMKVQFELFLECFKYSCEITSKGTNLNAQIQSNQSYKQQIYDILRGQSYAASKQLFESHIKQNNLNILDKVTVEVKVKEDKIPNQSTYQVSIIDIRPDEDILKEIFGKNIFYSDLTSSLKIKEISFLISEKYLGQFIIIKSQPFQLPKLVHDITANIFHMTYPVLNLQGGFHLRQNILSKLTVPDYIEITAKIQSQDKQSQPIQGINYSFKDLGFGLSFLLQSEEKISYSIGWKITAQMNITNISENPIVLDSCFESISGNKILKASINQQVKNLFHFKALNVKNLNLKINFTRKTVDFGFAVKIDDINLSMESSYSEDLISMKANLHDLKLRDIVNLINRLAEQSFETDLELKFQTVQLGAQWNRKAKEMNFQFLVTIVLEKTTFYGSLFYSKKELALQASADSVQFDILNSKIVLENPTVKIGRVEEQLSYLKYEGILKYISKTSESHAQVKTFLGFQRFNQQNQYYLSADIDLSLQENLGKFLSILSNIQTIQLVYQTENYKRDNYQKGGKYLLIRTKQFILFNQKTHLNIKFDLESYMLSASLLPKIDENDKSSFLILKSVTLSVLFSMANPEIKLQIATISPKLQNAQFIGALTFGAGKIGGSLQMIGEWQYNKNIRIGYTKQSGKSTKLGVAVQGGELWDFDLSGRIKVYDFEAQGSVAIKKNILTHVDLTIINLDFVEFVKGLLKMISGQNNQPLQKLDQKRSLLAIKNLTFSYDLDPFHIMADLDVEILKNNFLLQVEVNRSKIFFDFQIKQKISIADIIVLSSADNSQKGPAVKLQLRNNKFDFLIDCQLRFGPITAAAKIQMFQKLFYTKVKLQLFDVKFQTQISMNTEKHQYKFSFTFDSTQNEGVTEFVRTVAESNQKFNKPNLNKSEIGIKQLASQHNQFCKEFQIYKDNIKKVEQSLQASMRSCFGQEAKENNNIRYNESLTERKKILEQVQQKTKKMMEMQNYINFKMSQNQNLKANQELNFKQVQSLKQQIIKLKQMETDKRKKYKNNSQQLKLFSELQKPNVGGAWDTFCGWVKAAIDFIVNLVKKVVEVVIPKVNFFKIAGEVFDGKFGAQIQLKFKFLGQDFHINIKWGDHFDRKLIQQKSISQMIGCSFSYLGTKYIIPKVYFTEYEDKKIEEIYKALGQGKLQGLTVIYQPEINYIQHGIKNFHPHLTLSDNPSKIDMYEEKRESKYCHTFGHNLDFTFTQNNYIRSGRQISNQTTRLTMKTVFCAYEAGDQLITKGFFVTEGRKADTVSQKWGYQDRYQDFIDFANVGVYYMFKVGTQTQSKQTYLKYICRTNTGTTKKLIAKKINEKENRYKLQWVNQDDYSNQKACELWKEIGPKPESLSMD